MAESTQNRSIISSSGWGLWVVGAVAIIIIIGLIAGAWRLWRAASSAVTKDVTPVVQDEQTRSTLRFVRTPTQIIIVDDPIIPEGETALEDVYYETQDYLGETVVISGTISDFESSAFFGLRQDEDSINVIALPEVIELNELNDLIDGKDTLVRITGIVKVLTKEIEKKGFGLQVKNLDEAFWSDQLVIEAVKVEKIDKLSV